VDEPYVFISYARADQDYVDRLAEHLRTNGVTPWFDRETDYGEQWPEVIREHVDGCWAFVVVMSPASEKSKWVKREIVRAEQQAKATLPLLLDGLVFFELNTTQCEDVSDGRLPSPTFLKRLRHLTSMTTATPPDRGDRDLLRTATDWADEGKRLGNLGRHEEALAAFDQAVALDPSYARAHYNRGHALHNLGRHEEALAAADRAIALDPNLAAAHNNRGIALGNLGRHEEALTAYGRAIALDPDDARAHNNRGVDLASLGRYEEALVAFDRAIALDPNDARAHNSRGNALENLGRHEEARTARQRAAELGSPRT
jgi:tetratricopeptide (TPR) repeat protein